MLKENNFETETICSQDVKEYLSTGSFTNYVDKILTFFDHLPPCVDIFYGIIVDKKWTFLDHLSTHLHL